MEISTLIIKSFTLGHGFRPLWPRIKEVEFFSIFSLCTPTVVKDKVNTLLCYSVRNVLILFCEIHCLWVRY